MKGRAARLLLVLGAAFGALALMPRPALAHPLGNFTINVYAGVVVGADDIFVDYVVDMAEIPAFQERSRIDADGDDEVSAQELQAYVEAACSGLAGGLEVRTGSEPVTLLAQPGPVGFRPGQAGLQTLRIECTFHGALGGSNGSATIEVRDANFARRIGWREITASGDGATIIASDVPETGTSERLLLYPVAELGSPPDVRRATITVRLDGGSVQPPRAQDPQVAATAEGVQGLAAFVTGLVGHRDLTLGVGLLAIVAALALGAFHTLAPGHGKAIVAAYAVAGRGPIRQALWIGVAAAGAHTAGVAALAIAVTASSAFAPEHLYPWFGLLSGAMIAAIGLGLLRRAAASRQHVWEDHPHHHDHPHARAGWRSVVGLGLAGGMVPSPSALVVLLGAMALGRGWLGVVLVAAYGLGMALTLMGTALVSRRAGRWIEGRIGSRARSLVPAFRLTTAICVTLVGLGLATRAAVTLA